MHNTRGKIIKAIVLIVIVIVLNGGLNFVLMPSSFVRIDLHNIISKPNTYQYIFVGTSHGQFGIDPASVDRVTGGKSTSLCMADQYPIDTYYLVKETLKHQKPKKIIYEIDSSYWITDQRVGTPLVFICKEFPKSWDKIEYCIEKLLKKDYRTTLFPWIYYRNLCVDMKENVKNKCSKSYQNYSAKAVEIPQSYYKGEGFIYRNIIANEYKGTYNNIPWDKSQVRGDALKYFHKIVNLCKENKVELELVVTPVPEETIANAKESYTEADAFFARLAKKNKIKYHNFNNLDSETLDRSLSGYWDYDGHMYGKFAEKFSKVIGNHLVEKESKKRCLESE